ncbi:MAG: GNAT family N-acetyltransferase [Chloroflexi bacterium]|nr:GNAT family N-acetyltransferase [Chloroflexota bacterium]
MAIATRQAEMLITTYLEMTSPAHFAPAFVQANDVEIVRMEMPDLGFYKFLYQSVGEEWAWRDRLQIPNAELRRILTSPRTQVYVMYVSGSPAGYVELYKHDDNAVEIAYFGLRRDYMGRGLGKHLLSYGVARAWEMDATRVWLHTCNLDGPHALANYQKRGFRIFKVVEEPMPELYT